MSDGETSGEDDDDYDEEMSGGDDDDDDEEMSGEDDDDEMSGDDDKDEDMSGDDDDDDAAMLFMAPSASAVDRQGVESDESDLDEVTEGGEAGTVEERLLAAISGDPGAIVASLNASDYEARLVGEMALGEGTLMALGEGTWTGGYEDDDDDISPAEDEAL
jgi:hypothetical protein